MYLWTLDADGLLSQALLTGNFEAAVEICMIENKMAEAIILAIAGGPDLLSRTQKRFFQKSKCSIGRVWRFKILLFSRLYLPVNLVLLHHTMLQELVRIHDRACVIVN